MHKAFFIPFFFLQCTLVGAAPTADNTVFLLPLECSELLPDNTPFVRFFESVARGRLRQDKTFAKRIFEVVALRDRIQNTGAQAREQNPIDLLIRKTLCFYREKKDPLRLVPYDDADFLAYLKPNLGDLEKKVAEVIAQREYDREQRLEYERMLTQNQALEDAVRAQAELAAEKEYERLAKKARMKAKAP